MTQESNVFGAFSNAPVISEINLDEIKSDPNQPRKFFDEKKLKELADSIDQHGLKQPVLLRPDPSGSGYIITAGERRTRAHRLLKRQVIVAIVGDEADAPVISIIENLQREDLSPFEEATAIATLIQERGIKQGEAAKLLGKSRVEINQLLRINSLPAQITEDSADVKVSKSLLIELAQLSDDALQLKLWGKAKDGDLRVRDVRAAKDERAQTETESEGVRRRTPAAKALAQIQRATGTLLRSELSDEDRNAVQTAIAELEGVLSENETAIIDA